MSEVEKLRALLVEARDLLSKWCWSGTCCELRQRIDAALAEPVRDDYQRGAKAMREAAARVVLRSQLSTPLEISTMIRDLPMPEDKP